MCETRSKFTKDVAANGFGAGDMKKPSLMSGYSTHMHPLTGIQP